MQKHPGNLDTLRSMVRLAGEEIRTRRDSSKQPAYAIWAHDIRTEATWTWDLGDGVVLREPIEFCSWRPFYEPFMFHTDEEWRRIDTQQPHPNQHVFDRMARGAEMMSGAPNPISLLHSARRGPP